jgi:predicted metal-dependent hydrolase
VNNQRRKDIAKAAALIEDAKSILEDALAEEQEYLDNMPESFQNGEKGELAQAAIDALDEAGQHLDDAISAIETAGE